MLRVLSKNEPHPIQNHNFRPTPGIDLHWRGGHIVRPLNGQWFGPKWPTVVVRLYCPLRILPFVRWRFHRTVGYFGFKAFGVDVPEYLNWMPLDHVQPGSVALTPSLRFDADDH